MCVCCDGSVVFGFSAGSALSLECSVLVDVR